MRNLVLQTSSKILFSMVIIFLFFFLPISLKANHVNRGENQENQIKKAKIFREIYPVISESDLYCSFFVLDEERLDLRIVRAEREYEKQLLTDGDVVYVNKGQRDGLEEGQVFLVLEVGPNIKNFGHLGFKRGRARILAIEKDMATAKIEKSCGQVMVGNFLVPFEEKEGLLGKDLGYQVPPFESEGVKGNLIYLQRDYNQIASGHWALINLGEEDGLQIGQQLIIYRKLKEGAPLHIIGNLIVIDTQRKTSTVKILSCSDALRAGDQVQARS